MEYRCTGLSAKGGGGVGGGGKLMRADGKGKKGQEKRKERETRTYPPHPRISAMKDKKMECPGKLTATIYR